ncbi:MAG: aminotransferase class V-fold PLP-dependent enzyme [Syntrophotaleaceae bacterium]
MHRVYLDNNASTDLHPEVLEDMMPYLRDRFGNPSSPHWPGQEARKAVEKARGQLAHLVNCDPEEVIFTSSATESNNTAIKGVAASRAERAKGIVTTIVEHPSVLMPCYYLEQQGFGVTCLDVDRHGCLDLAAVESSFTNETCLLSVMHANNETGTLFPVAEIGRLARGKGVVFHCDAAQAVGKVPVDFKASEIDLMSLSGHKFYGPKGIGALIVRKGLKFHPLLHGGAQEQNRRAGTENVAGIVGLGKACELAAKTVAKESLRLENLRDRLEQGILEMIPDVRRNGDVDHRLPNTSNMSFLGVDSEKLLFALDQTGIAVSSVSACSSGTLKTSRVLEAMGAVEGTRVGTLRFSLGMATSGEDVNLVLEVLPNLVQRMRASGSKG